LIAAGVDRGRRRSRPAAIATVGDRDLELTADTTGGRHEYVSDNVT
jgi:hypothetical protein